jgi:hypothetical protein
VSITTTVSPSSRMPAWRLAVIGLVAALSVGIGVAAGAALLAQRTAGVGSGASYVPADAPFFVELRLDPSAAQDAALRELLGRFPAIDGVDLDLPLYAQLADHIDELLLEQGAEVSWADDVAPWFDGHVAMALTDIPAAMLEPPADPMAMPPVPEFVVLLGVTDAAAAADGIDRILGQAGEGAPTFTESQHLGFTIRSADDGGAYALTDDQLVVASDADGVRAALDRHAAGADTLAEMAEITRLTDALPADWLAFVTYDMTELMTEAFGQAAELEPGLAGAFDSLMEHQSLRGAMAVSSTGDRLLLDAAMDPATGPFAPVNADRGLADEVPSDALYYSEGGNLGIALAAMIEPFAQAMAAMPDGEEQLRTVEAALGGDLSEMVSWIGDGAMVIGYDGSQPYGGLVLVPNDVEAAEGRLGQLESLAALGALDPEAGISVDVAEVAGVSVTTIRWDAGDVTVMMQPAPTGLVVEYAVTDDRALIGFGDAFVRRVLELAEADSLAAVPRYADAVAGLGGAENAGVGWLDVAGAREALESSMGPLLDSVDPTGEYHALVRPWLIPLDRIVSVSRLEGEVFVQRGALLVE